MADALTKHSDEIEAGERFEFGRNWARFLRRINDERVDLAIDSLRRMLQIDRMDGMRFLDIGSGSGLFSLAARRLGARVHSFDYDPQSVACTRAMRNRYFASDPQWSVEQGSVLDVDYLRSLGSFDVVYSWGVLHHTGAMFDAFQNVKPLVQPNGLLYIAIYNDEGEVTDRWARIKQRYNQLPRTASTLYAAGVVASVEWRALIHHARNRDVGTWLRTWTEYDKVSRRGMSRWHDWIDWIGGYPYERATVEHIVDEFAKDGFRLTNLFDCSGGYGCNEFVFRREGSLGDAIDVRIRGGRSILRRYGFRVVSDGHVSTRSVTAPSLAKAGRTGVLFKNRRLLGAVDIDAEGRVDLSSCGAVGSEDVVHVVPGELRERPAAFTHERGFMWSWSIPELMSLADNDPEHHNASPVYLFEDGVQLALPHSIHDDIAVHGSGRFSHWGTQMLFAPNDNNDPNSGARRFQIVIASESSRSTAKDA